MTFTLPDGWTPRAMAIVVIIAVAVALLIYAQFRRENPFDFWDLLIDHATGRASLDSTITLVCCAVGIWYVIARSTDDEFDTTGGAGDFLRNLIMIMVIYRGARTAINAYKTRIPDPPEAPDMIGQQVIVTPSQDDGGRLAPIKSPPSAIYKPPPA